MGIINSQGNGCFSLLGDSRVWLIFGFIVSIKFMLINRYSTDFEVFYYPFGCFPYTQSAFEFPVFFPDHEQNQNF